jgi:outer membrane protein, multidrug efflux system
MRAPALTLIGTALLAACAVPPPALQRPAAIEALLPAAAASAPVAPDAQAQSEAVLAFWRGFGDAELGALVEQALKANPDVRTAAARVREVRALAGLTEARGQPSLGAQAGAGRARQSGSTANNFSVGLQAGWEIDLFGALAADRAAAQATLRASELGVQAAQVSVAAELARAYFALRGAQAQLKVAEQALQTQQAALKLLQARLDAGRGTALDTERARTLVANTAASVPALQASVQRSQFRLAALVAQPPQTLQGRLTEPRPLPGLTARPLDASTNVQALLQRRPDIAVAQAQYAAAGAGSAAERRRIWPTLKLAGSVGLNDGRLADLVSSNAFVWGLGASLAWNLIDGGAKQAQIAAADARTELATLQYERVVLGALEETASALDSFSHGARQVDALVTAVAASQRAAELAQARFDAGASDFLVVLDAERERLAAGNQLAQAQTAQALALVAVYQALAGGW